ncbi:AAA family ATPase [Campylobacter fetus]|uniref:AAA family ATPase n=1 Tax=Campylobacter fetus TaxID=196 RepID=UPI000818C53C|nr:ATP-binding protein [Campylobacter fetus]OCR98879.1 hypothetical protein A9K75_09470 [Campylobacter fetus subsp. testudinum]
METKVGKIETFTPKTKVIKIFGGSGAGKSTLAAKIFVELKINYSGTVEWIPEFAKQLVWKEAFESLKNQNYVTRGQRDLLMPLINKVNVLITDSPLELGLLYAPNSYYKNDVQEVVDKCNSKFESINIFLERGNFKFEKQGRIHTLEQSIEVDNRILNELNLDFIRINHNMSMDEILSKININNSSALDDIKTEMKQKNTDLLRNR